MPVSQATPDRLVLRSQRLIGMAVAGAFMFAGGLYLAVFLPNRAVSGHRGADGAHLDIRRATLLSRRLETRIPLAEVAHVGTEQVRRVGRLYIETRDGFRYHPFTTADAAAVEGQADRLRRFLRNRGATSVRVGDVHEGWAYLGTLSAFAVGLLGIAGGLTSRVATVDRAERAIEIESGLPGRRRRRRITFDEVRRIGSRPYKGREHAFLDLELADGSAVVVYTGPLAGQVERDQALASLRAAIPDASQEARPA